MKDTDYLLSGVELNRDRVQGFLYEEFNHFQENFELEEDSARQDMRGAFFSWFMVFAPELFPADLTDEIATYLDDAVDLPSYRTFGWHNTMHLRAGLFSLTDDRIWIEGALGNLGHENSLLRVYAANALALIAPQLQADDETLIDRIAFNYKSRHFFNDCGLLLFAAADGDSGKKKRQLQTWQRTFDPEASHFDKIGSLLSGEWIGNPFAPHFRRAERYALLRLCIRQKLVPPQLIGVKRHGGAAALPEIDAALILSRVESHPLAGEFASFDELNLSEHAVN